MKKTAFLLFSLLLFGKLYSQTIDTIKRIPQYKNLCLLIGAGYGKYPFTELGLSVNQFRGGSPHPFTSSYFLSTEIYLSNKPILAPKAGIWVTLFTFVFGMNAVYYTDFHNESFVLRPEMGFGFDRFKLTVGYNSKLNNKSFDRIAKNCLSLVYCFKLKNLKSR